MDLATLKEFEGEVQKIVPGFEVRYKDQSALLKFLGFLAYPFNPGFMTKYTTTLKPAVYFPTKAYYENSGSSFTTLAHEMVHLTDGMKTKTFSWSYALPQWLALFPLLAYIALDPKHAWIFPIVLGAYLFGCLLGRASVALFWCSLIAGIVGASVLSILLSKWYSTCFFGGLVMLAPWPSPWRSKWELRGYTMNMAVMFWTIGWIPDLLKTSILNKFITSNYFFMSWRGSSMMSKINEAAKQIESGEIQSQYPYSVVYGFLNSRGLIVKK